MTFVGVISTCVLSVWFALTVVVQFPSQRLKSLRQFEPTGHLLPGWNFFAPKPIAADIELMFRHVPAGEELDHPTEWAAVLPPAGNTLATLLFNPARRRHKVLFYCCYRILAAVGREKPKQTELTLSVPYILLLDRVSALCSGSQAVQFQINVVRYGVAAESKTAYRSLLHAVD